MQDLKDELIVAFRQRSFSTEEGMLFIASWRPVLFSFRNMLRQVNKDPSLESEAVKIISGYLTWHDDHAHTPRIVKLFSDGLSILNSRPAAATVTTTISTLVPTVGAGAVVAVIVGGGAARAGLPVVALMAVGGSLFGLFASKAIASRRSSSSSEKLEKFEVALKTRQADLLAGLAKGMSPKALLPEMFDVQLVTWAYDLLRELDT